jgi:hypothetical protein
VQHRRHWRDGNQLNKLIFQRASTPSLLEIPLGEAQKLPAINRAFAIHQFGSSSNNFPLAIKKRLMTGDSRAYEKALLVLGRGTQSH